MKCGLFTRNNFRSLKLYFRKQYVSTSTMAKSMFEYVKQFERQDQCLPNCWIVVRVDGQNFSKFSDVHKFAKPNDPRALDLMRRAAASVMNKYNDIVISYGQSDEFSFVFKKDTTLYKRRDAKILSYVNSLFTSSYVFHWSEYMGDLKLQYPPSFDARTVLYPTDQNLRDYLSWRQADVHINNLYNTCFWNLVKKKGMTNEKAQERLKGTFSADKNELLFQEFGINYNNEPQYYRKGTTLLRKSVSDEGGKVRQTVVPYVDDIIGEKFWRENPQIMGSRKRTKPKNSAASPSTNSSDESAALAS